MKSKDIQNLVLSKYKKGEAPKKIFQDLNGSVSYRTVERWCKMVRETGTIDLSKPPGCHRTVRTKAAIQKVKRKRKGSKKISCRRLAFEMEISRSSVHRILKQDLQLKAYKKVQEPLLTDEHKARRKTFRKEDTQRIVFSDEKMFDLDGIYNSQNDRIWAAN
jgi:transposase